jgi:hypothetical protein
VLEEYSGELCQISLNARFGWAQYRTVKVRSEKEKKQTNILVDTTSELKSSLRMLRLQMELGLFVNLCDNFE